MTARDHQIGKAKINLVHKCPAPRACQKVPPPDLPTRRMISHSASMVAIFALAQHVTATRCPQRQRVLTYHEETNSPHTSFRQATIKQPKTKMSCTNLIERLLRKTLVTARCGEPWTWWSEDCRTQDQSMQDTRTSPDIQAPHSSWPSSKDPRGGGFPRPASCQLVDEIDSLCALSPSCLQGPPAGTSHCALARWYLRSLSVRVLTRVTPSRVGCP